jgi:hypothetical protein
MNMQQPAYSQVLESHQVRTGMCVRTDSTQQRPPFASAHIPECAADKDVYVLYQPVVYNFLVCMTWIKYSLVSPK